MEMEISNSLARSLQYTWVFTYNKRPKPNTVISEYNTYLNMYHEYTSLTYLH